MQIIPIDEIKITANRQRQEFTTVDLIDLKDSILRCGLMHPIVVRNDGKTLVAGERRLRAIQLIHKEDRAVFCNNQHIPKGYIMVSLLSDLSELEVEEAELEENIKRVDLTWQEKAIAIDRLAELRKKQAEVEGKKFTAADLTEELCGKRTGGHSTDLRDARILAQNMDIPEVASAPDKKSALKALQQIRIKEERATRLETFQQAGIQHQAILGSFTIEATKILAPESVDLILTDPPYGIAANNFGSQSSTGHAYEDSNIDDVKTLWIDLAQIGFQVAKPQAHCYIFHSIEYFAELQNIFASFGWQVWPRPLIWSKQNGMLPRPSHGPRYTYESILFASKGNKPTQVVKPDVISCSPEVSLTHGAQKPVNLLKDLISRSCMPTDLIVDFCAGSGSVIPAAEEMKCRAITFEVQPDSHQLCLDRIYQLENADE